MNIFSSVERLDEKLYEAIVKNDKVEVNRLLLDRGESVNPLRKYKSTPLHAAAESGSTEVVRLLLDRGARVDALDIYNCTPLYMAALYNHVEAARLLLDAGANVNALNKYHDTPFNAAIESGSTEVVRLFHDHLVLSMQNNPVAETDTAIRTSILNNASSSRKRALSSVGIEESPAKKQ